MRLTPTPFRTSLTNPRYKAESSNSNLELEVIAPSKVATSYNILHYYATIHSTDTAPWD